MGRPIDVIGRAYEPRPTAGDIAGHRLLEALTAFLQLIVPVTLLLVLASAAFIYGGRPVTWLGPRNGEWLTVGHLILPLTFFAIHLTNRRYGAGYALMQIALAWALGGIALWAAAGDLPELAGRALPAMNEIVGFGSALFVAQLFCVPVFDRTRGPRWWTAPFFASFWGGVVFCAVAFPVTYLGTSVDWLGRAEVYLGIMAGAAFVQLLPYCLLRRMVPPLSGFGGY